MKLNPEKVQTLTEVKAQISSSADRSSSQQEFFSEFVAELPEQVDSRAPSAPTTS